MKEPLTINEGLIIEEEVSAAGRKLIELTAGWLGGDEPIVGNLVGDKRLGWPQYCWTVNRSPEQLSFWGKKTANDNGELVRVEIDYAVAEIRLTQFVNNYDKSAQRYDSRYIIPIVGETVDLGGQEEVVKNKRLHEMGLSELTLAELADILNELVELVPELDMVETNKLKSDEWTKFFKLLRLRKRIRL